jgi:hypothetical protein
MERRRGKKSRKRLEAKCFQFHGGERGNCVMRKVFPSKLQRKVSSRLDLSEEMSRFRTLFPVMAMASELDSFSEGFTRQVVIGYQIMISP